MMQRQKIFPVFLLFLSLSLVIALLSKTPVLSPVYSVLETVMLPAQRSVYATSLHVKSDTRSPEVIRLEKENAKLQTELARLQAIVRENQALHDQFAAAPTQATSLFPATVSGVTGYFPGISSAETLTIDRGSSDGLHIGLSFPITIFCERTL